MKIKINMSTNRELNTYLYETGFYKRELVVQEFLINFVNRFSNMFNVKLKSDIKYCMYERDTFNGFCFTFAPNGEFICLGDLEDFYGDKFGSYKRMKEVERSFPYIGICEVLLLPNEDSPRICQFDDNRIQVSFLLQTHPKYPYAYGLDCVDDVSVVYDCTYDKKHKNGVAINITKNIDKEYIEEDYKCILKFIELLNDSVLFDIEDFRKLNDITGLYGHIIDVLSSTNNNNLT